MARWKILRDPIAAIGGGAIGVAKGLKASALQTSGLAPLASTLSSGGSLFGSRRGRGRGAGRGGGSSKSETGILNTFKYIKKRGAKPKYRSI